MASSGSSKDLSKALGTFFQAPSLPLPDDLNAIIDAFLEKHHHQYDDAVAERLNEELLSIYTKSVEGHAEKLAAFIAVFIRLLQIIRTPLIVMAWWDRLVDPIMESIGREKGVAREALNGVLYLSLNDEEETTGPTDTGLNPYSDRFLKRWMKLYRDAQAGQDPTAAFKFQLIQEGLMVYAKKDPKSFMAALDVFVVKRDTRNQALTLLADFIQTQPPHLHLVLQTPLFGSLLTSLQKDSSTTTVALALMALIMLMPYIPSSLLPFLPTLFNIYARLLFWDRDKSYAAVHTENEVDMAAGHGSTWEESLLNPDNDPYSIPHLPTYFTLLYGLYPINFVDYIRKPQRYLRHANNAEDIDVQASEIRDRSGRFRQCHLLHPNFYNLTIETEKTDLSRWIKSEADEVLADCMALSLMPESTDALYPLAPALSPPPRESADRESLNPALLGSSAAGDAASSRESLSGPWRQTPSTAMDSQTGLGPSRALSARRSSQSSHPSAKESLDTKSREPGLDSPTLPPHLAQSPSSSQLQDMIQSNKAIKAGIQQSLGNESVLSLTLSHQDSIPEKTSVHLLPPHQSPSVPGTAVESSEQVSHLYHQSLLLQNDLQFEKYMKQQHMAHIGELRRKQLREAATEAETQNLVMAVRNLRHRWEDSKRAESQMKKESDHRRAMAKKWEADLSAKLKVVREEQKTWGSTKAELERELQTTKTECERLRKAISEAEDKKLKAEQALEGVGINTDEIARLRKDVTRLSATEREFQGKENKMQAAIEEAAAAEARAGQLAAELAARDQQLQQSIRLYESQVAALSTKLAEAQKSNQSQRQGDVTAVFESALAASRAKQSELQKQYSTLMRKYTVLQSSLLDMQCDTAERKARSNDLARSRSYEPGAEPMSIVGSPIDTRTRTHRGLSDPEVPEGSPGSGGQRPSTPLTSPIDASAGKNSPERYFGRGGVQNTVRKDRKEDKPDKTDKKDKKSLGMQRIRGFV